MSVGIVSGRPLINSTKSNGPKMLPCGTPEVTCDQFDATHVTSLMPRHQLSIAHRVDIPA